mmetsp:Transcript_49429/g.131214  ORF Transcript_49429/g.131214 Transcript_49429/m.131214 type:complete len:230 (+) Transcript_49429:1195-1884(+)
MLAQHHAQKHRSDLNVFLPRVHQRAQSFIDLLQHPIDVRDLSLRGASRAPLARVLAPFRHARQLGFLFPTSRTCIIRFFCSHRAACKPMFPKRADKARIHRGGVALECGQLRQQRFRKGRASSALHAVPKQRKHQVWLALRWRDQQLGRDRDRGGLFCLAPSRQQRSRIFRVGCFLVVTDVFQVRAPRLCDGTVPVVPARRKLGGIRGCNHRHPQLPHQVLHALADGGV